MKLLVRLFYRSYVWLAVVRGIQRNAECTVEYRAAVVHSVMSKGADRQGVHLARG